MKIKLISQSRSNSNYICIPCRVAKKGFFGATCGLCGEEMESIGKKRRVPKKNDTKSWDKLIESISDPKPKTETKVLAGKSPRSKAIKLKEKSIKTKLKQDNQND